MKANEKPPGARRSILPEWVRATFAVAISICDDVLPIRSCYGLAETLSNNLHFDCDKSFWPALTGRSWVVLARNFPPDPNQFRESV
jgi:hypothetical protein